MKKVVHLIPYDGLGGVESAARTLMDGNHGRINLLKVYIANDLAGVNSFRNFALTIRRVLDCSPDLLVASLWRSVAIALVCKLFRPRMKLAVFLHNSNDSHFVDRLVNWLGIIFSSEVWADSQATINSRFHYYFGKRVRVISFLLQHIPGFRRNSVAPKFIFWGRLNKQKALDKAIRLFSKVAACTPNSEFLIIGPDNGERSKLESLIYSLGLNNVSIVDAMDRGAILDVAEKYNFFLQTSVREGMCISVVEAMQHGLVPVVTPVGEIANYCLNGINSCLIDDGFSISALMEVIEDPERYFSMSFSASQSWADKEIYAYDFILACDSALN